MPFYKPVKVPTECCALCQFRLGNETPIWEIERTIKEMKEEAKEYWYGTPTDAGGQRAIFTIVTPFEGFLEEKLIEVGFKEIAQFERRTGYGMGNLKMYFYSF